MDNTYKVDEAAMITGPMLQLIVLTYFGRRLKIRVPGLYPWNVDATKSDQKTTK